METQRKDQTISKDRQVWEITNKKEGKKKKTCQLSEKAQQSQSYVQTDATTPTIVGPTMLVVVVSVCTWLKVWLVSNSGQQLPTTRNNMQQGVQMEATCNIQQCWELLANIDASVCTGLKRRVLTLLNREL